jgi:2-dehydropantoate 2-reductase
LLQPLLSKETAVLTLQNGLGSDEELASLVGAERVIGGLAFIALNRTAPGEVWCFHHGSLTIGEYDRAPLARTKGLAAQLRAAGIKVDVADNLASARWHKLVWNIPFNGLTIVNGGVTTDRICADPRLAARVRVLMKEVQAGAQKCGHIIHDDFLRGQFDVTPPMGAYRPSSLVDFLAGREVEIEAIWGEPLRRAQAAGAEMPELSRLYEELKQAMSNR